MDRLQEVEHALSADLVRVGVLGAKPPKVADRYVITRLLGRGASGVVVAAQDLRLGRTVALKLGVLGADMSMVAEARALAALDHPNVVRVHDVTIEEAIFDGQAFRLSLVCMQYVAGSTLRVWLHQEPRTWRQILEVFTAAGRGLAAAHASKLVHRDFKLDNVLIRADGVAQVIDFGFALSAQSSAWTSDAHAQIAGTYPYMAPEARRGHVTRRSDQYSFGISLVEALVGDPRPASGAAPPGVPVAVWRALGRATSPEAGDRFPDMDALLAVLETGLRTDVARPRGVLLLSGVVIAALLGLAGVAAYPQWSSFSPRLRLAPPPEDQGAQPLTGRSVHRDQGLLLGRDAAVPDVGLPGAPPPEPMLHLGLQAVDAEPPTTAPARADAGVPDADALPARVCPDAAGTYVLTTERERGGLATDATFGSYRLVLSGTANALRAALTKTGASSVLPVPRRLWDVLENPQATRQPDCALALTARHGTRRYQFLLTFRGSGGGGTFSAEGDRARGPFSGSVRIQKVTAR